MPCQYRPSSVNQAIVDLLVRRAKSDAVAATKYLERGLWLELITIAGVIREELVNASQMPPDKQWEACGVPHVTVWLKTTPEGRAAATAIQKLPPGTPGAHAARVVEDHFYRAFPALAMMQRAGRRGLPTIPTDEMIIGNLLSELVRDSLDDMKKRYLGVE